MSTGNILTNWYERQIGTPTTTDEANGYWLFVAGVLVGLAGFILFFLTDAQTGERGIAYALAALAPPFIMLGAVIRFPLVRVGTYLGYAGALIAFAGVVWFVSIFPGGWSTSTGNTEVMIAYGVGIFLLGIVGAFVPMIRSTEETAAQIGEDSVSEAHTEVNELRSQLAETQQQLAGLTKSQARFEVYEDKGGQYRWRLRHRNGNVIADSGEGYTRRSNAQNGLQSVRRNAYAAGIIELKDEPEDADEPDVGLDEPTSQGTFELYSDSSGEHRWRLRHSNGNIIADCGEGYSSAREARKAIDRVTKYVPSATYLWVDPAGFEVFEDRGGEYRWRLVHRNGNILADSGEGYTRRADARRAARGVRDKFETYSVEFYTDNADEHRWRLESANGEIVADSGEGYASANGVEEAFERVSDYIDDAEVLEIGDAAFEIYQDKGDEHRWRLRHRNGNILADSGEGYARRSGARDGILSVKRHAVGAEIDER